jgi:hypothetical protein
MERPQRPSSQMNDSVTAVFGDNPRVPIFKERRGRSRVQCALIPQFIAASQGSIAFQFVVLGLISVAINTGMALLVVTTASSLRNRFAGDGHLVRRPRRISGAFLGGLGRCPESSAPQPPTRCYAPASTRSAYCALLPSGLYCLRKAITSFTF